MSAPRIEPMEATAAGGHEQGAVRRRLILVCGAGGTGKTTLANLLSHELDIACLHKDDIKASLHDVGIATTRSFEVFLALTEKLLSNGIDLIIEATMHVPADWGALRLWQQTFDLDLVCVICSADRDERERRIRTRDRHPAHAGADERQLAELDVVTDYSQLPGTHIDVSTQQSPPLSARAVLDRLQHRVDERPPMEHPLPDDPGDTPLWT